jgi:hypothetical protein
VFDFSGHFYAYGRSIQAKQIPGSLEMTGKITFLSLLFKKFHCIINSEDTTQATEYV